MSKFLNVLSTVSFRRHLVRLFRPLSHKHLWGSIK